MYAYKHIHTHTHTATANFNLDFRKQSNYNGLAISRLALATLLTQKRLKMDFFLCRGKYLEIKLNVSMLNSIGFKV